jgi:hypothetical protein
MEKTDKAFFGIAIGVVVLTAACFPLVQRLDDQTDRMRLMYDDRESMVWLQYQSVTATGRAVAVELSDGDSARIAGEVFRPSAGVTVVVRAPEAGSYCVQVSNQYGDVSRWACLDEESPPRDPDAPPDTGL